MKPRPRTCSEYDDCLRGCGNRTPHKTSVCLACRNKEKPKAKPRKYWPVVYVEGV